MKQTAVEWFLTELEKMQYFIGNDMLEAYKQAKELEKQQIIDAFQYKFFHPYAENEPEIYYNETYKPSA
jgi:hypothetical protein